MSLNVNIMSLSILIMSLNVFFFGEGTSFNVNILKSVLYLKMSIVFWFGVHVCVHVHNAFGGSLRLFYWWKIWPEPRGVDML